MKSKLTRMKPEELGSMKFKEAKMILKKDLSVLQTLGAEGTTFFIATEFDFDDKKGAPILVVGDLKGEWKKYAKDQTKPPHKTTAAGTCTMSEDGAVLNLNIEKGKAKPKAIEKALKKGKLIPSTVNKINFKEVTVDSTEEEEELDSMNEATADKKDELFSKIVTEFKNYKTLLSAETEERLAKITEIDRIIADWEKEFSSQLGENEKIAAKNKKLQDLRQELYAQRIEMNVANRKKIQDIAPIEKTWADYKKRPGKSPGLEMLPELEERVEILTDLKEDIQAWYTNNPPPLCPAETENKGKLDKIVAELDKSLAETQGHLPGARKAHTKLMLDMLSTASDEKKKELAGDSDFIVEMARSIPVEHINTARKFLGLEPVKEEKKADEKPEEAGPEWTDPKVLEAFKKFEHVAEFSEDVIHRKDPTIDEIEVTFPAGAKIQEKGSKDFITLSEAFTFQLISEDKKGRMKLLAGDTTYYGSRDDMQGITHFEKTAIPLFNGSPSKNDVVQGGLGDCYLLAALTSLVAKDSAAIEDMMLDKGDTVTVRLFHVTANKKGEKQFKARYFNIAKSVPVNSEGGDLYAEGSLWVQMLEKAYTAGRFVGAFGDYKGNLKAAGKYSEIEGGFSSFAYEVLTGKPAALLEYHAAKPEDVAITGIANTERGNPKGNTMNMVKLPWGTDERNMYKSVKKPDDYKKLNSYVILGNDLEKTKKWFQFVAKKSISKLFKREYDSDYSGAITLEDFELLFQGKMKDAQDNDVAGLPALDAGIASLIMDWIKKAQLYPGKRGSGVYSALQLNLFNEVKTALDAGNLVSVGSKVNVGREVEGLGHSGGEAMSGGLVGSHAYTILKYREDKDPQKELLLRNPWGQSVQENIKVSDLIAETLPKLEALVKKELKELKDDLLTRKAELEALKAEYDAETDPKEKKEQLEVLKISKEEYDEMKAAFDAAKSLGVEELEDKLYFYKKEYNGLLKAIQAMRKKDPNALISKKVDKSKEAGTDGGEFWMFLEDLTHRFDQIYVG